MVLLQWYSSRAYRHICRNLHYNMVLLQWSDSIGARRNNSWFTFQYGSTSIRVDYESIVIFKIFTFQYGSTSMQAEQPRMEKLKYLHSNMVLLQYELHQCFSLLFPIYIPIWFYFNTTRRLNILSWRHLHSNMVLLQF